MMATAGPVLYALFVWWFSTGLILYLDRLPRHTFRWSLLGAKVVFLDRVLAEAYRANLVERITTVDILLLAPVLVVAGAVVSALTAWATLRITVRR